jgi:hypothetical protein
MDEEKPEVEYPTRTYGIITKDIILTVRDTLRDIVAEAESTLDDVEEIIDWAFEFVGDVRELSQKELKEYINRIEVALSHLCDLVYNRTSKCGDCPLRFQCRYAEDMFGRRYSEMSEEERRIELEKELELESIRRHKSIEELRRLYGL